MKLVTMKDHERPLVKILIRCIGTPAFLRCQYPRMTSSVAAGVERGNLSTEELLGMLGWKSKRNGVAKALCRPDNIFTL